MMKNLGLFILAIILVVLISCKKEEYYDQNARIKILNHTYVDIDSLKISGEENQLLGNEVLHTFYHIEKGSKSNQVGLLNVPVNLIFEAFVEGIRFQGKFRQEGLGFTFKEDNQEKEVLLSESYTFGIIEFDIDKQYCHVVLEGF